MESKKTDESKENLLEKAISQAIANSQLDDIFVKDHEVNDLKNSIKYMVLKREDNHYDRGRTL